MNREQKTAVVEEVAAQIEGAEAVFAVDYRGISVPQAADLRQKLNEAGARFRVVKNTLTLLAAERAGAEDLKGLLEGPTAFTFVMADGGDVALAAKALAQFRRQHDVLDFKGGRMNGEPLTIEQLQDLARLPGVEVLHGQLVGTLAAPVTGLVRGLNQLIAGLALQLGQIAEQGLVGGEASSAENDDAPTPDPDETDQQDGEDQPVDAEESAQDDAADSEAAESAGDEGGDEETSSEDSSPQDDDENQEG
jgi:large subunit ribosomal protein L10